MTAEAKIKLSIDGTVTVVDGLNKVDSSFDSIDKRATSVQKSLKAIDPVMKQNTMSAAAMANAMRMVPAQMTDIVVSLEGGQKPLTVLLQQGGQLKDMFGGVVPAAKALATYITDMINPVTVAAAVLGGLAYAAYKGHEDFELFNNTLKMTGGYTGKTIHDIDDMAARIVLSNGKIGDAREAIRLLVATGKVNGDQLQSFGHAALEMAKDTGASIQDVVKDLSDLGAEPIKWAEKYNAQYHFLTAEQYLLAKSYEEAGNKAAAATVVVDALHTAHARMFGDAEKNLGSLQRYYADWLGGVERIKNALLSIGAPDANDNIKKMNQLFSVREQIEANLANAEALHDYATARRFQNQLAINKELINGLRDRMDLEKKAVADQKAVANKATNTINLNHYLDDTKYADKGTKYSQDVKAENAAFAEAVKGFEVASKEYEQAFKRHKANLAQIADQDTTKEQKSYDALIEKIKNETAADLQQLKQNDKISEAQKNRIALNEKESSGIEKITAKKIGMAHALSDAQLAAEKLVKTYLGDKDSTNFIAESAISRQESSAQLSIEYALYGKTNDARDIAMVRIKEETALEKFLQKEKQDGKIVSESQLALLKQETESRIAVEQATLSQGKALSYAQQLSEENARYAAASTGTEEQRLKALLEYDADVWRKRIKNAGDGTQAQEMLVDEFLQWYRDQKKELDFNLKIIGLNTIADEFDSLSKTANTFNGELKKIAGSLGNMGNAFRDLAKAEEKEHQGQKGAMADRIGAYGEMADAAKGFFNEGTAGYKTLDGVAKVFHIAQMAMQLEQMTQGAIAAVINQAQGDPYSAWARMAAMAAAMAALGFAVGGGFDHSSAGVSAAQRQQTQGTGSVLGDASAKSESISKAMDDLKKNSDTSLPISQQMLAELQGINAAMTGLSQILFRTAGITSGNGLSIFEGITHVNEPSWLSSGLKNGMEKIDRDGNPLGGPMYELDKSISNVVQHAVANLFGKTSASITDSGLSINGTLGNVSQGHGISQYANVHTTTSSLFGLSKNSSDSTVYGAVDATIADQIGKVFKGIEDTILTASSTFVSDTTGIQKQLQDYVVNIPTISLRGLTGQALQDALNAVFSNFSDTLTKTVLPGLDDFQQVGEGYYQTAIRIVSGVESADAALAKFGITAINFKDIVNKQGDVAVEIMRQSIDAVEKGSNSVETGVGKIVDAFDGTAQDLTKLYQSLTDIRTLLNDTGLHGQDLSAAYIQGAGGIDQLNSGLSTYLDKFFTPQEKAAAEVKDVAAKFALLGVQMPTTLASFRALVSSIDTSTDAGAKLAGSIIALADPFSTALGDATSGLNDLVASLTSFRDSLNAGVYGSQNPTAQTAAARSALDRAYTLALSGDTNAANSIQNLAQTFLNDSKVSSASQLAYAMDVAAVKQIVNNVINAANTQSSLASILASQSSGPMLHISGSHADGLDYVPYDNYLANLHEGEGVLTKKQNQEYQNQPGNDAVIAKLDEMKKELNLTRAITAKLLNRFQHVTQDGKAMLTQVATS